MVPHFYDVNRTVASSDGVNTGPASEIWFGDAVQSGLKCLYFEGPPPT